MATKTEIKSKNGGARFPTREALYSRVANHLPDAIDKAVWIMNNSKQESNVLGAIKVLMDKGLPDLKAIEVSGEDGGPLQIEIIKDANNNNNE